MDSLVLRPNELRIEEDFRGPEPFGTDLDSLIVNEQKTALSGRIPTLSFLPSGNLYSTLFSFALAVLPDHSFSSLTGSKHTYECDSLMLRTISFSALVWNT